jgi:hypothetical protein
LRESKDFVSESAKEAMKKRTDWGDLFTPDAEEMALPPRTVPDDTYRWPEW